MALKSTEELRQDFIVEMQSQDPTLTDTQAGSIIDIFSGVVSVAVSEISRVLTDEFAKTYIDTAQGPEETGGPDDLQRLLVDHFGEEFARPAASKATGIVTFSRPTTGAGNVTIPVDTIVKTPPNASGEAQRFRVVSQVIMTGLTINASVEAVNAGIDGNVQASTVTVIESVLTDNTVTVNNSAAFAGGEPIPNDAEYREFARNLLRTLRGGTLEAIVSAALNVPGVEMAVGKEFVIPVIEWDIGPELPIGDYFLIARPRLYIADANGSADATLVAAVRDAIEFVRAAGVFINIIGAVAIELDFKITITLNPSGPNFAELSNDPQPIIDTMTQYIQDLEIGEDFIRAQAKIHIMNIWGPSGTNDLTNLTVTFPGGDVSVADNQKLVPGLVEIE